MFMSVSASKGRPTGDRHLINKWTICALVLLRRVSLSYSQGQQILFAENNFSGCVIDKRKPTLGAQAWSHKTHTHTPYGPHTRSVL